MAIIIAVTNHKGGVGKTTTVANTGAGLVRKSKKMHVLVIDLDPQSNLTQNLFPHERRDYKGQTTIAQVLGGAAIIDDAIVPTSIKGLDLVPSHIDLFEQEPNIQNGAGAVLGLHSALSRSDVLNKYDFILIDCPPNLGTFMTNALYAASHVIIPIEASNRFALDGIQSLFKKVNDVNVFKQGTKTQTLGYLITRCDMRTNIAKTMTTAIRQAFGDLVFRTAIRSNTDFDKAIMLNKTIFQQDLRASGASDYSDVASEIIERLKFKLPSPELVVQKEGTEREVPVT
ncbi:MAG: ParA family protein [Nitrospira sp.]|nr:ParA family protein [Nitrospira sp.]MCA9500971.1 ParA family protein [Nitrospira sp.]MDR4483151.1 ParA family protein [Nitrospirales bacterium]HQU27917.1 ParA family protein [Nitrospirales bacterium]